MSWDPVWEEIYRARDWTRYPTEDIVRFVAVRFPERRTRHPRVVDLGCGTGGNLWFLAREGCEGIGIDGSATALAKARARLAEDGLAAQLEQLDLNGLSAALAPASVDGVVAMGSLQCNRLAEARAIAAQARDLLRPGGWFLATVTAVGTTGYGSGTEVEPGTFTDIPVGALKGMGLIHYYTEHEVRSLAEGLVDVRLGWFSRSLDGTDEYRHWVVEGRRA